MLGILWIRIVFLLPLRSECASWARYLKLTTTKIIIKVFNTLKNITRYHSCLRENLSKQILSNVFVRHRRTAKKRNLTFNNIKYNSLNISKVIDCRRKNTCLKKMQVVCSKIQYLPSIPTGVTWPSTPCSLAWTGQSTTILTAMLISRIGKFASSGIPYSEYREHLSHLFCSFAFSSKNIGTYYVFLLLI